MSDADFDTINLILDHGIDVNSRTIYLSNNYDENGDDEIGSHTTEQIFKALKALETISLDPITIILNTSGGDSHQGVAIYDLIKRCPCEVTIKIYGTAHSMGAVILQAADKRIMSKNSTMLLHYGQTSIDAESDNFKRWQLEYERLEGVMEDIVYKKVKKKLTRKKLRDMMKFDTILDADKALGFGLIDEVEE